MDAPNTQDDREQILLNWQMRLAAREQELQRFQAALVEWTNVLSRLSGLQAEIAALQRGEPLVDRSDGSPRPSLRLVPKPEPEKDPP